MHCSTPCFIAIAILSFIKPSYAGFGYPPLVSGLKRINIPGNPDIFVTYKEPSNEICRTTNPDQRQYSGHIHIPPSVLAPIQQEYPINTFFWFFEAREAPQNAPLTIWLNGGPGSSSMLGLMQEVGPCKPVPANRESITTIPREWSWDGLSNMLFIDQPNQVGFSYDTPTNGSLPLLDVNGRFIPGKTAPPVDEQPRGDQVFLKNRTSEGYMDAIQQLALVNGTFPSGNGDFTANTTQIAATAVWHFLQAWLFLFPQYNPNSTGVNLFAESYGGKYGPTFFEYFEKQNRRRQAGEIDLDKTIEIHLESLGIINGCVDALLMTPSYLDYAHNNPYGIIAIDAAKRDLGHRMFEQPGGCNELVRECRRMLKEKDSGNFGDNNETNKMCSDAAESCDTIRSIHYRLSKLSFYDITADRMDTFPGEYHMEYLNNETVLEAIGAQTNYTQSNARVFYNFKDTGDFVRGGQLESIAYLLQNGVRVALIYGDRDYICNYQGGESVSLNINYPGSEAFRAAGYQDIVVNDSYVGGQVRQYGNFSFSRIFNAGHLVPSYQPECAYRVFERVIKGLSIATGEEIQTSGDDIYSTTGNANTTKRLTRPQPNQPICFVRDIRSCNNAQWLAVANKEAVIFNGVVYNSTDDYPKLDPLPPYPPTSNDKQGGDSGNEDEPTRNRGAVTINSPSSGALLVAVAFCIAFFVDMYFYD